MPKNHSTRQRGLDAHNKFNPRATMAVKHQSHSKIEKTPLAFTADTLPIAVGRLFEMNNYSVDYNVNINGAQIDLIARAKGDPFGATVFIEATIEHVSNDKYGKDATKFLLLKRTHPDCTCLCVSAKGFSAPVKERAAESGVVALSYDELFMRFEKFGPYVQDALNDVTNQRLIEVYEEPLFSDDKGTESATKWLNEWRHSTHEGARWLIVLGEYGTGKTSLTRVLQYRWLQEYHNNTSMPVPIRIELRNFTRQFDARGLLHHFLDTNKLSHIPVDFLVHLIKNGRVVLILDGYDEMAQFLNARERRSCLRALAELAADGAMGILTSRPNYFTEAEELTVFEALYTTIEQSRYHLTQIDRSFIAEEKSVDNLIESYVLNRFERHLQDLTPEQTESLVRRNLRDDVAGQELVLTMLRKIFRDDADGTTRALSGKPVIIAYLLELVDEIRKDKDGLDAEHLTEWQIYKLIVDRLMFRDLRRSPMSPTDRRAALQKLAIVLSGRSSIIADEATFHKIIEDKFRTELRRMQPDERRARRDELFEDLRSSATLTRAHGSRTDGWNFSHNSLREYLAAEMFLESLSSRSPVEIVIPVSAAMRSFAGSITEENRTALLQVLADLWPQRGAHHSLGPYLTLLWEAARRQQGGLRGSLLALSGNNSGEIVQLSSVALKQLDFQKDFQGSALCINAAGSELEEINFEGIDLTRSDFTGATLDAISFRGCDLSECTFGSALLFECDLVGATLSGADFKDLDKDSHIIVKLTDYSVCTLSDKFAIGYLRYHGAITSEIEDYFVHYHNPKFSILEKICERLTDQKYSQLRGLTQRGEARSDPPFARGFVDRLVNMGWVEIGRNNLVSATALGRNVLSQFVSHKEMPDAIGKFLSEWD